MKHSVNHHRNGKHTYSSVRLGKEDPGRSGLERMGMVMEEHDMGGAYGENRGSQENSQNDKELTELA